MAKAQFVFLNSQPPAKAGGNSLTSFETMFSIATGFSLWIMRERFLFDFSRNVEAGKFWLKQNLYS
ncbi:hypothetical protein EGI31_22535 [Lacihabitans soyangensis]|uniref:Uncharacterized protein n=1 Tax=Lacihabitans soyangensis TaxID=869394 RepID=A0AAE3H6F7_9BACT|nr:hypothetical protein [Lacihabitans soyangensis]